MVFENPKKTKSPLKDRPLRNPGESLENEIQRVFDEKIVVYLFIIGMTWLMAGLEWRQYIKPTPPQPVLATVFAGSVTLFCIFKLVTLIKKVRKMRLGYSGEKAVGQYLELLREKGCRIFHDIVEKNFNIDHVIISNHGIYVIETKTYSKPIKGDAIITYDGERILKNGFKLHSDPIIQAKAAATEIRTILKESTGKEYFVKPVVVFPGWFIKDNGANRKSDVWVLEPKALPGFIEGQTEILSIEDLKLAAYHLSRYIRTL